MIIESLLKQSVLVAALSVGEKRAVRQDLDYTLKNIELDAALESLIEAVPGAFRLGSEVRRVIKSRARAALRVTAKDQMARMSRLIESGVGFELAYSEVLSPERLSAILDTISHGVDENTNFQVSKRERGLSYKQWITMDDDRVRHSHAEINEQKRRIEDPFDVAGFPADYPGDFSLPLNQKINCRCTVEYS